MLTLPRRCRSARAAAAAAALALLALPHVPHAQPAPSPGTTPRPAVRRPAAAAPAATKPRATRRPARSAAAVAGPRVDEFQLANGLTVIFAPDSSAAAADVAVWYRAGSAHEMPGMSGVTHLFERLMFSTGTGGATDYRRRLGAEGAVVNTFTTPDFTSFFATVPAEAVELAIRLEAERMSRLDVTPAALETEREFVREERRQFVEANPVGRGIERLFAAAFPGHGYGRPVLGLEEDLAQIGIAEVRAYYRDRYAPSNAVLTVMGRFDPAVARVAVESAFGALPGRGLATTPGASTLPAPAARARETIDGRFALLLAGWRGPAASDPLAPAFEALSEIATGGPGARLQRAAAGGEGRLFQVRGGLDARRDASLLYAWGVVASHADSAAAESTMVRTLETLAREPVREDELARARRSLELAWLADRQSVRGRARAIGVDELVAGNPNAGVARLDAIRALTPAQVQAAARRALRPENRTIVWMMPDAAAGGGR